MFAFIWNQFQQHKLKIRTQTEGPTFFPHSREKQQTTLSFFLLLSFYWLVSFLLSYSQLNTVIILHEKREGSFSKVLKPQHWKISNCISWKEKTVTIYHHKHPYSKDKGLENNKSKLLYEHIVWNPCSPELCSSQ